MTKFTISRLAEQAEVNLQTIRYYEREELLLPVARTEAGYRIYPKEAVLRIRFIKRAQELGFSLSEVRELLALRMDEHATKANVRARARAKLADVEGKIARLGSIGESLRRLTESCSGCGPVGECPILENLDGKEF